MNPYEIKRELEYDSHDLPWPGGANRDDSLEREYVRQYARFWYLLREHSQELNRGGVNMILDCIHLRERDLAKVQAR